MGEGSGFGSDGMDMQGLDAAGKGSVHFAEEGYSAVQKFLLLLVILAVAAGFVTMKVRGRGEVKAEEGEKEEEINEEMRDV